jgi:hypothetical protein
MPSSGEVAQALYGTWRFARLDRGAMRFFDLSHQGVWRSFWAAAICYPIFVILLIHRLDAETLAQSSYLHILFVETIAYVASWAAFPLIALGFCRWIGREEQGFDFIVVYNWSQVPQVALSMLVALAVKPLLPEDSAIDCDGLLLIATAFYEWFIALVAIGAGGWIAAALVVTDFFLTAILFEIAASLY